MIVSFFSLHRAGAIVHFDTSGQSSTHADSARAHLADQRVMLVDESNPLPFTKTQLAKAKPFPPGGCQAGYGDFLPRFGFGEIHESDSRVTSNVEDRVSLQLRLILC